MRELSIIDMEVVGGGDMSAADAIAAGTALGGGVGLGLAQRFGLTAAQGLMMAGYFSVATGAVTAAAIGGYMAGQALNEHTPIQKWISNLIDKIQSADGDE